MNLRSLCLHQLRRSLVVLSLPVLLVSATSAFAASQTITFPLIADQSGAPKQITINNISSTSNLPVFVDATPSNVCLINENVVVPQPPGSSTSRTLSLLQAGTCSLSASQGGDANFSPAPNIYFSFQVAQTGLIAQTIILPLNGDQVFSSGFVLILTGGYASSGLSVTRTSLTPAVCEITTAQPDMILPLLPPGTMFLRMLSVGVCTLRTSQEGNANFSPAIPVEQSFKITATDTTPRELSLAANIINPRAGTPIKLSALVRGVRPGGLVSFTSTQISDPTNTPVPVVGCTNVFVSPLVFDINSAVAACTTVAETGARRYTATHSNDSRNVVNPAMVTTNSLAVGPLDYGDIWWGGSAESGWGLTIAQKGLQQFNTFYVYDAGGKPVWYVMSGGTWNANYTSFTGAIYQPTGAAFSDYDARRWQIGAAVGSGTLTFTDANNAVIDYAINGVKAKKAISRFKFGATDVAAQILVNDIWWAGEAENGWGVSIAQQDRSLFAAWYTYGADGKATWFITSGGTWVGTIYTSDLFTTNGSAWLGTQYNAAAFRTQSVGSVTFNFSDANNAKMTYTVNGVTQSKVIQRLAF
jgi:hypothetical protein